ncbi:hypothetical protein M3Y97_01155300 [Aphelenchoides bicaudatus]|nr:hypothetical protein M3Y97_01155300 [Aphelenchoides bicaudatus]
MQFNITGAFLHPKGGLRPPDPNIKIPVFHVVLVVASILLIVCAILTALIIYLRVLQMARRRTRRRKSDVTTTEEAVPTNRRPRPVSRASSPAVLKSATPVQRQKLEIKVEEF